MVSVTNGDLKAMLFPYPTSSKIEPLAAVSIFACGQLDIEELEMGLGGLLKDTVGYGEVVWVED